MWEYEPFVVPDFENRRIIGFEPIAEFIKSRLVALNGAFATSTDTNEKHEIVAQMTMCAASLSLLTLGYVAERDSVIEMTRELIRRTQT